MKPEIFTEKFPQCKTDTQLQWLVDFVHTFDKIQEDYQSAYRSYYYWFPWMFLTFRADQHWGNLVKTQEQARVTLVEEVNKLTEYLSRYKIDDNMLWSIQYVVVDAFSKTALITPEIERLHFASQKFGGVHFASPPKWSDFITFLQTLLVGVRTEERKVEEPPKVTIAATVVQLDDIKASSVAAPVLHQAPAVIPTDPVDGGLRTNTRRVSYGSKPNLF